MKKQIIAGLIAALASLSAQADVVTFTDRAAFQAAVAGYTVDDLDSLANGFQNTMDRGAYTINIQSYGCTNGAGDCGDNSAQGFNYPAYLWTYNPGTFQFTNAINAFGLDFGAYGSPVAQVSLNGQFYSASGGSFFGIIDTANTFTTVNYAAAGSGSLLDNVSYGMAAPAEVPEPGSLALFAIALAGFGIMRRRAA
jgi:hypothetical protein